MAKLDFGGSLATQGRYELDALLLVPPFGPIHHPSLGASILRDSVLGRGLRAEISYLTFGAVEIFGLDPYEKISEFYPDTNKLFGEWIFSRIFYDEELSENTVREYLEAEKYKGSAHQLEIDQICKSVGSTSDQIRKFLDATIESTRNQAHVYGFTSMFQQHFCSLILAKLLKTAQPDSLVVFGGANCEGSMGIESLKHFPFIDCIVSGPGEIVFPELVYCHRNHLPKPKLRGVSYQNEDSHNARVNAPEAELELLPLPLFDDFMHEYAGSPSVSSLGLTPSVLIETSRGCWWGQKHHCTFCGLNGSTIKFRGKSAGRALADLSLLSCRYPGSQIVVTDNIMPQNYYFSLLPKMRKDDYPGGLFFEIKSNIKIEHALKLASAGVNTVQVGIESLANQSLREMKKGVTAIANIACLKFCAMYDIRANWILLFGFPGETQLEYDENYFACSQITHLAPPIVVSTIRIDRFSPNFMDPVGHGFTDIRPIPAYGEIYRSSVVDLNEIAYFFEPCPTTSLEFDTQQKRLRNLATEWQKHDGLCEFWAIPFGANDLVFDGRGFHACSEMFWLDEFNTRILRACVECVSVSKLEKEFGIEAIRSVDALTQMKILFREGDNVLSLPLSFVEGGIRPSEGVREAVLRAGRPSADEKDLAFQVDPLDYQGIHRVKVEDELYET